MEGEGEDQRLAKEILARYTDGETSGTIGDMLIDAIRAEREACAKIAEDNTDFRMLQDFGMQSMCDQLCTNIASAIRARENEKGK